MKTMDYRMVDVLNADQLEVNDLIGVADEILDDEQFELFILE
jgi:hypothetical protein